MINVNQLNVKIKFEYFFDLPDHKWKDFRFYENLDKEFYTNYQWLNTFKDKIDWHRLLACKRIKLKFLKSFAGYFDELSWQLISTHQQHHRKLTPQFINKFHKKLDMDLVLTHGEFTANQFGKIITNYR